MVTIDRGKKNREIRELLARYTNLSMILVDKRITPTALLYAFVKHHQTMEAAVERCFVQGGCYRRRLKRGGGLDPY